MIRGAARLLAAVTLSLGISTLAGWMIASAGYPYAAIVVWGFGTSALGLTMAVAVGGGR